MPTTSVDMIVNCMDSHENSFLKDQAWYQSHVKWLKQCRAPVFTIDPPIETVDIVPKWCLYPMLPLARLDMTSQMYLCDLGLPRKVFKDAGVTYRSPFGHKFIIPLHPPSSQEGNCWQRQFKHYQPGRTSAGEQSSKHGD